MTLQSFIERHGLTGDRDTFLRCTEEFRAEMEAGLTRAGSSLKMIPAFISLDDTPAAVDKVIAVDMGGTNMRVALVEVAGDVGIRIADLNKMPMPGTRGELDKAAFFGAFADAVQPYLSQTRTVGLCFSFPCEIQPDLDGRILLFNKEVRVRGAENAVLGRELDATLRARGLPGLQRFAVINDTVATLLGAKAQFGRRPFDSYIGLILGTGTNACYIEENAGITKNPILCQKPGTSLINMESGGYAGAPRSAVDDAFDAGTQAPGTQLLEKMISGAYQGGLLLAYLHQAAREGCFSPAVSDRVLALEELEGAEIDQFCFYPDGENKLADLAGGDEAQRELVYRLVDAYFARSAMLVAASLAAVMRKTGKGRSPLYPVCISAEGSTFYKCKLLNEKIGYYTAHYIRAGLGIHSEFVQADNATLTGSAYAAMLAGPFGEGEE